MIDKNKQDNLEYIELFQRNVNLLYEKEKIIIKDCPYIESKYLYYFGELMIEELYQNKKIKELKVKQYFYENYFRLKRENYKLDMEKELSKQTNNLDLEIKKIKEKYKNSKQILYKKEKNIDIEDKIDRLFYGVVSNIHPRLYELKDYNLWIKAKKAYIDYDLSTLYMLNNIKINQKHRLTVEKLKRNVQLLEKEIKFTKKIYPYYLDENLSDELWRKAYGLQMKDRVNQLEKQEKDMSDYFNLYNYL